MWRLRELFNARLSWITVLVLLLIYFFTVKCGENNTVALYEKFGLTKEGLIQGRLWQLFSYAFLHGSWSHVISNSVLILMMGSRVEWILGSRVFLKIVTLGVISGGIFHLLLNSRDVGVLVGFSAACMSLLTAFTTLSPDSKMMFLPVTGKNMGRGILISSILLALMNPSLRLPIFSTAGIWLSQIAGDNFFQIGHACHFGGGVAGYLVAKWVLRIPETSVTLKEKRSRNKKRSSV
jgi:membrane associated rhomboid family serine protease